jgi:hypothetical protein
MCETWGRAVAHFDCPEHLLWRLRLMRKTVLLLVLIGVATALVGCGDMFTAPYDIQRAAPGAEKEPADVVPQSVEGAKLSGTSAQTLMGTVSGTEVTAEYDNGVTLKVLKAESTEQANQRIDTFYESEMRANTKSKMGAGEYVWAKGTGSDYWAFAWTNGEWVFICEAKSQAEAEKVILSTGFASERSK